MLETHQVHRRAFQFQLQGLAVQHGIQARDAMLVGAEAAVPVVIVVVLLGLGGGQGQQGEGEGEQQAAHGWSPAGAKMAVTL
ncbi:hypothetical protein D9M69_571040 [compost metagenome]